MRRGKGGIGVEIRKTKKAGFVEYKSSCVLDPYCQVFFFFGRICPVCL